MGLILASVQMNIVGLQANIFRDANNDLSLEFNHVNVTMRFW